MQRNQILKTVLIVFIIYLLLRYVGLGTILGIILYIIGAMVVLAILTSIVISYRINRLRRQAEAEGRNFDRKQYGWGFGNHTRQSNEGDVTVQGDNASKKRVNDNVGEYVDFQEVDHQEPSDKTE